jgi:hypothetical protein
MSKRMIKEKHGEELFLKWRRSYGMFLLLFFLLLFMLYILYSLLTHYLT